MAYAGCIGGKFSVFSGNCTAEGYVHELYRVLRGRKLGNEELKKGRQCDYIALYLLENGQTELEKQQVHDVFPPPPSPWYEQSNEA